MRYEDILEYVQGLVGTGDDILAGTSERSDELRDSGVFQIDQSSGRLLELLARIRSPKQYWRLAQELVTVHCG